MRVFQMTPKTTTNPSRANQSIKKLKTTKQLFHQICLVGLRHQRLTQRPRLHPQAPRAPHGGKTPEDVGPREPEAAQRPGQRRQHRSHAGGSAGGAKRAAQHPAAESGERDGCRPKGSPSGAPSARSRAPAHGRGRRPAEQRQ